MVFEVGLERNYNATTLWGGRELMEPATGLTILGGAIGGAKVAEKVLGPTAEYIGDGLKTWTQRRVQNVANVFEIAAKLLGPKLDQPGAVPPKVLKEVIDQASSNDDRLAGEYFGGVLASSRTEVSRDDRGARFISLIGSLTSYQLRTHYLLYSGFKAAFNGTALNPLSSADRNKLKIFTSFIEYVGAMDFTEKESADALVSHAFFGLNRDGLIENFVFGSVETVRSLVPNANEPGIAVIPTVSGFELFLWAHGLGEKSAREFFNVGTVFEVDTTIPVLKVIAVQ